MLPIKFTVVSNPAISNSVHSGTISAGVTASPSPPTSLLITSSPGSRRRVSNTDTKIRSSACWARMSSPACLIDCSPPRALPNVAP